jgi:hypothetical protein
LDRAGDVSEYSQSLDRFVVLDGNDIKAGVRLNLSLPIRLNEFDVPHLHIGNLNECERAERLSVGAKRTVFAMGTGMGAAETWTKAPTRRDEKKRACLAKNMVKWAFLRVNVCVWLVGAVLRAVAGLGVKLKA